MRGRCRDDRVRSDAERWVILRMVSGGQIAAGPYGAIRCVSQWGFVKRHMTGSEACSTLATAIDALGTGYLVVVTGAGVSHASGIPTFRGTDPGAVWKRDVTELGTNRYFEEDPAGSWTWYTSRFDMVLEKQPNPAHHALAAIERWQVARGGRFLLVTQNVDPLHERAGSERLVKVHGSPTACVARATVAPTAPRADPCRAPISTCGRFTPSRWRRTYRAARPAAPCCASTCSGSTSSTTSTATTSGSGWPKRRGRWTHASSSAPPSRSE